MPLDQEQLRTALLAIIKTLAPETDTAQIVGSLPLRKQIDLDSMDWLNVASDAPATCPLSLIASAWA